VWCPIYVKIIPNISILVGLYHDQWVKYIIFNVLIFYV
jgi:hypothetical protein